MFEFHEATGATINSGLTKPGDRDLRMRLIREELKELTDAMYKWEQIFYQDNKEDPVVVFIEICDALGDLDYVVAGAAVAFGVPLPEIAREVHRSNMTKLEDDGQPILRGDGKVLKGKNYEPPNIEQVLFEVGIIEYAGDGSEATFVEGWNA